MKKQLKLWLVRNNQFCFTVLATGSVEAKKKFAKQCGLAYSRAYVAVEVKRLCRHDPVGEPTWWSVEYAGGFTTNLVTGECIAE